MQMSMMVGLKLPHDEGKKSRCSEVTMMTKRSNHMPMLMKMLITNITGMLVRSFFDQKSWGEITLQVIIDQYAHQSGPVARLMNTYFSYGLPEYQAMKNSIAYA